MCPDFGTFFSPDFGTVFGAQIPYIPPFTFYETHFLQVLLHFKESGS